MKTNFVLQVDVKGSGFSIAATMDNGSTLRQVDVAETPASLKKKLTKIIDDADFSIQPAQPVRPPAASESGKK